MKKNKLKECARCRRVYRRVYTQTIIIIIIIIITLLMYPETGRVGGEEGGRGLAESIYYVCLYIYRVYLNISRRHSWYTRIGYYYYIVSF